MENRRVEAGVLQGSILGLLLWNIAYDDVLRTELEEECSIIGYADDTLVIAAANNVENALVRANLQTSRVLRRIRGLGLEVAPRKTEAVVFRKKGKKMRQEDREAEVVVDGERILVGIQ